jgi:hypothetical protein
LRSASKKMPTELTMFTICKTSVILFALATFSACAAEDIIIGPGSDTGISGTADFTGGDVSEDSSPDLIHETSAETGAETSPNEVANPDAADDSDTSTPADVTPELVPETSPDVPGPAVCIQDNDGTILASELPVAFEASPNYVANPMGSTVAVNPQGVVDEGTQVWDFRDIPTQPTGALFVDEPGEYWFAEHFPSATFVSPLTPRDPNVLGVYQADETGVRLMGLGSESPEPAGQKTLMVYDTPVDLLRFPITLGDKHTVTSNFTNALLQGTPNAGEETYSVHVDAMGTVKLPVFTVENCLRVRIDIDQRFVISTSADPIHSIQYLFLHECVGEIARISSMSGETSADFTEAHEFRMLGL